MSDNLISLQNKRISILEKQLEKEQAKLEQLNKLYDKNCKPPIIIEIEKVASKWDITLPSGIVIEKLDSLKHCSLLIQENFGMVDGEIIDLNDKAEEQINSTIALAKKVRNTKTKRVQSKVKKIDARIFDRTY